MTTTKTRIGNCLWAGHAFTTTATVAAFTPCPDCEPVNGQRSHIKWATLKTRTTKTPCDSACTSAKGDKCHCECGGTNHGDAHRRIA